jgi:hypothetical protein
MVIWLRYDAAMKQTPIFHSEAQAIEVMFSILARLSALVMWVLIALVHLGLLLVLLAGCWLFGVTAADVAAAYVQLRQTMPVEELSFVGVSVGTLLAGWLWFLRKAHQASAGLWLTNYLMKGL